MIFDSPPLMVSLLNKTVPGNDLNCVDQQFRHHVEYGYKNHDQ